ncbi:MAG: hypothetical protein M3463_06455 [Verrucomicrobiota bacterium]|nr:hypothetical protein [Verrucomicrobiota bacterium]
MKLAALSSVSLFAVLSSALAVSVLFEITPEKPTAAGFTFDIRHEPLAHGSVKFRVAVTEVTATFRNNVPIVVGTVEISERSQRINPQRQVSVEKEGRAIVCVFSVSKASLDDPNVCFIVTNPARPTMVNGKEFQPPSAHFVYASPAALHHAAT